MSQSRSLAALLAALAAGLAGIAVLGPLLTGVIDYRYSETMLNQGIGLDAFALAVVAPIALLAAGLSLRGHRAAPLLALGPAGFAAYMMVQYVVGPEYLRIDGNGERAFLLFIAVFVLAVLVLVRAWTSGAAPVWEARTSRRRGVTLLLLAAFIGPGMYVANGFPSAMWDFPAYVLDRAATSEYDEHPTAFWLVAFLDLGIVVPLTVATGLGVLRGRRWAQQAFYGVMGWYALVPASVAVMAVTMLARNDPAAGAGRAVAFTVIAAVFLVLSARTYVPLLREDSTRPVGTEREASSR